MLNIQNEVPRSPESNAPGLILTEALQFFHERQQKLVLQSSDKVEQQCGGV